MTRFDIIGLSYLDDVARKRVGKAMRNYHGGLFGRTFCGGWGADEAIN